MNPMHDAINLVGGAAAMAKALGKSTQAVCFWRDGKRQIPADVCPSIERLTKRQVTCEALRPDVDWAFVRGTSEQQGRALTGV